MEEQAELPDPNSPETLEEGRQGLRKTILIAGAIDLVAALIALASGAVTVAIILFLVVAAGVPLVLRYIDGYLRRQGSEAR